MTYQIALRLLSQNNKEAALVIFNANCPNGLSLADHGNNRMKAIRVINATLEERK